MLHRAGLGFGGLAAAALLGEHSARGQSPSASLENGLHFAPRAKRVIFLFMKGGPSHIDTFDYKPKLQADDGKDLPFEKPRVTFAQTGKLLASPWKFQPHGEAGMLVSELFPNVAKQVDDICFLHGVHGTNAAHGGALLKLHTGSDNFVRPSLGSWVHYGLGSENNNLPGFVTICPTLAHGGVKNWGAAFLPAQHQGTPIGNASQPSREAAVKFLQSVRTKQEHQRRQLSVLAKLNEEMLAETGPLAELEGRIRSFELAFRMQAEMPEALDLSQESRSTLAAYGIDQPITEDFGRQCLMARRLCERGVRFVQVTHSDNNVQWDQHSNLLEGHNKNAKEVDQPIAALLGDLKQRGLLRDTLVIWSGEFGRTPTAQGKNGRDHNPEGFTVWMAGGGVKPGFRYGATDEYGYYAAENKMDMPDLHATILHLMGLDHERLTYRYAGRDFRLTDVSGEAATEIML